jgi:prephenate dehydrogenase
MNTPLVKKLALIGTGLIGGSFALALKKAHAVEQICGYSRTPEDLALAMKRGIIDTMAQDVAECVQNADLVMLAVPLRAMPDLFVAIKPFLKNDAILTDVGSAKTIVETYARAVWTEGLPQGFLPGHPIAGTEKSGVEAGFAELFQQRKVILTPVRETQPSALDTLTRIWQSTGASVECLDVHTHDDILAATSHLPHILAFGLVDLLAHHTKHAAVFRYAAGGFRDFTRIASSDPVMWRDICLTNREAISTNLKSYQDHLTELAHLIERGDGDGLQTLFSRAKQARDAFIDQSN